MSNRVTSYSIIAFSAFCLISSLFLFSVFVANKTSFFIEFNIAFVLGVSLPVLLTTFIVKPSYTALKRYPILLTLVLLTLLYSFSYLSQRSDYITLTFSALILQLSFFWSVKFHNKAVSAGNKVVSHLLSYVLLSLIFLFVLWLGIISADIAWLIFSVIQILLYGTSLLLSQGKIKTVSHGSLLLVVNTIFSGVIYAWLNEQLSSDSMVIIAVATYLLAMLNGCWQVISTLINNHSVEEYVDNNTGNMVFDPTTNLPSYQYALQVFSYTVKHQQHARYAAIVFKPINFQQVNAVLGHHNSDILLLQLAYCLQKSIKSDDELLNFSSNELPVRLARLQGVHFLVVMDVAQSKHSDEIIIEQLCQKLAKAVPGPMSFKSFSSYFKLVFGVAFIGKNSYSVNEVIAMAEDALLAADKQQKQISFFAEDLALFNQQQLQKMEQLKRDIAAGSLTWQVQPQIKLGSKALLGFELLMTWQQQNEKLDFNKIMVIAEQSGDAYTLCQQMVQQAFIFLKEIHYLATKVSIAIKLSNSCLLQPDLVDYIEQQALNYNIECQYLLIEIQEKSLLSNSQKVKTSIEQLKSLGVKIAIDEFSGSYEALRYLRRLAVSEIKINCHALAQAAAGPSDKAIINALINLTRKMELLLVGTNINSIEAEKAFLAMGGEYAQGKYYSSGVSLQALPNWLTSRSQPPLVLS